MKFKVEVRELNKSDLNPIFNLEIANIKIGVYLSDIRTKFRNWLIEQEVRHISGQLFRSVVLDFLKERKGLNCTNIGKPELNRLIVAFKRDIDKRVLGANKVSDFLNN